MDTTIQEFFAKVMELTVQGKMKWFSSDNQEFHNGVVEFGKEDMWIRFISNTGYVHGFIWGVPQVEICSGFLNTKLTEELRLAINPADVRENSMEFGPGIKEFLSLL